ncbi:VanZ family protein [Microbacterium resistens]|uniref:VanZ family protein n=1 Tax=Microbacterium resistens TaxID=156977 RepID=UPI001C5A03D9|nr:VanZ family protein [Microbacterium resistens]MBW1640467.1 VanZ family protein [Microbacterium resistens]
MQDQVLLGFLATGIGLVFGVLLFVPFVAISYRRRGRLTVGRLVLWLAALIYFWAIWTYTLLPLPDPDGIRCVGAILDPMSVVRDVQKAFARSAHPFTDPAILQLALNVLLFLPLGFFLRVLGGRGVVTALAVGFGLSLFIETTQLTGVWTIYPCAYRFFDVGDLMTNTAGAVLGSLLSLVVPARLRGSAASPDADRPRPVTRGRRLLAMLCDAIGYSIVAFGAGVVILLARLYILGESTAQGDDGLTTLIGTGGTSLVWLIWILVTGQSPGDAAVQLRYRGGPLPAALARVLRWAAGVGGISALALVGAAGEAWVWPLMALAVVLALFTRGGRGLPWLVSRQELTDAREPARSPRTNAQPNQITGA